MDCSLPGSSVHGILQARRLEWVAISFFGESSPKLGKPVVKLMHPSLVDVEKCQWLDYFSPACNAGDLGSISGSGRSPGERNGNLLQYSCLENPMDRGAWHVTVYGVARVRHD